MAAVTSAVVVGAGALMSYYGQQQQAEASKKAGELNAQSAEENAAISMRRAQEDARQFMIGFRKDTAQNRAQVGASGIQLEGSPLEVLQDNAASAERDYQNIIAGGTANRDAYYRSAKISRATGQAQSDAAQTGAAASLLQGAGSVYGAGRQSGAWK